MQVQVDFRLYAIFHEVFLEVYAINSNNIQSRKAENNEKDITAFEIRIAKVQV